MLETKLYVPRLRRGQVQRPRLVARLRRGSDAKLTLISAPAGFGKSTLLAEWLAATPSEDRSIAWLALDPADNDAGSFWRYLIAALATVAPGIGSQTLALLAEAQPPPIATLLAPLLNEVGALAGEVVLVLDDYHVIDEHDIQEGMSFFLEHLPPQAHVVLATRADPALPLARLRGRGELSELRAADLRFTPDEAADYFNEAMGLGLGVADIEVLEARTEGWIAALQLAALSMQGRDDTTGFIAGFAGDDRYIVDYLAEEVLQRQPEAIRGFLLQTSILSRINGPLADAITGQSGGRMTLEALDRGNLFLVPLDDRRQWYRYHHLFADVLRARLLDEQPDRVPDLHRRAAAWYDASGESAEAIAHALAGRDFELAADLAERAVPELRRTRQEAVGRRWLTALPEEVVKRRPVLSLEYAAVLMATGELDEAEQRLQDAERWFGPRATEPGMVVTDQARFRTVPGWIALYRAGQAQGRGDVDGVMRHAADALALADLDATLRGPASALMGLATLASGDLDAAYRLYAEGMVRLRDAGFYPDAVGGAVALADIRIAQGRLRDATAIYQEALQLSARHGDPVLPGTPDMDVGLADVARERGDLVAAERLLQASRDLGDHLGFPQHRYRTAIAMARLRQAHGDLAGALGFLREAERSYVSDYHPDPQPIAAMIARLWIAQGNLAEAEDWARAQRLSADDDLSYLREYEHVTLARILLARQIGASTGRSTGDAERLLDRLLEAADAGQRTGSVIEILILQARTLQARGEGRAALAPLERALTLAEPEGYVRIFVDEGEPMARLLDAAAKGGAAGATYARRVLSAFGPASPAGFRIPVDQGLIEPLSEREMDVLRLLGSDLDGPEIAAELVVSLNTVRTHTKNIYAKLGVNSRRAAVTRAEELGLLLRTRGR